MWLYRSHQQEQDLQLLPRVCSSCCGALPTEARLEPRQAEPEHQGLVPQSLQADCHQQHSVEQNDCVFYVCCKWWLLHPKMHKWQLPIPRARCHPKQVGANASLEVLSAFWPSTKCLFHGLVPYSADNTCSTTAYFSPGSQSVPLTEVSLMPVLHVYWALYSFPESEHLAFR